MDIATSTVNSTLVFQGIIHIITIIIYIGLLGLCIYCLILFIKLAKRGIKALDIYIKENNSKDDNI